MSPGDPRDDRVPRWPLLLFILAAALPLWDFALHLPQLPDPMASSFDGDGHAQGWMSQRGWLGLLVTVGLLNVFIFGLLPLGIEALMRRAPHRINLPAAARRAIARDPAARRRAAWVTARYMHLLGLFMAATMVCATHGVLAANLPAAPGLSPGWVFVPLVPTLLWALLGVFWMLRELRRL